MARILLARHAQSEWNADGRWQGQADPPLSELGQRQASAAGRALGTFDAVWASDLERAAHTAAILSEAIGVGPVMIDPALRERTAGEWEGLTKRQIDEQYPGYLDNGDRPPGWESDDSMVDRIVPALQRIAAEVGDTHAEVLIVAHGGVVYSLEAHLGCSFKRIPNLGGRWILVRDERLHLGERVQLIPDEVPTTRPDIL